MEIDPIKKRFAHFIREWYENTWKATGKSRRKCAEYLGISYSQLTNILNSYRISSEAGRIRICKRLGVDYLDVIASPDTKPETRPCLKDPPADPLHRKRLASKTVR